MSDTPLPKPSAPAPPATVGQSGSQDRAVYPPSPSQVGHTNAPQTQQVQQTPSPTAPVNQQVGSPALVSPPPAPAQPPAQTSTPPSPSAPQIRTAEQVSHSGGQAPPPQRPQMPPASIGALSSMTSNSLPSKPSIPSSQPQANGGKNGVGQGGSPQNKPAQPKKSILRFLPLILGGVVLLGVLAFAASRFFGGGQTTSINPGSSAPAQQTVGGNTSGDTIVLEYWSLWEPPSVMESVIQDFESQNPGITVRFTQQSHRDYRERLQTAIASGNGPDVFRFHASWTPMLSNELAPIPNSVFSAQQFQQAFYPVAYQQLQSNGQLVGIPLMYDGLTLLYNTEIFETAGVQPPETWSELKNLASTLTVRGSSGQIQRGGIAMGNATNVEHFSDILAVLMLQNGADLKKPNSPQTRDALLFYTNFIEDDRVWSETLPNSSIAFARGEVAMIFVPTWRVHEIQAMNPDLQFRASPLPKLSNERISWATYWAEGVSSKGKNKDAAWKLLSFLSSAEAQQKMFAEQSKSRSFGELYSRTELADSLAGNQYVEAVLQDAPYATGWYLSSNTFDKGVNDQMIKYYQDAVTAVLDGKSMESVLQTLDLGTTQVLRQYGATGTSGTQR